MRNVCDNDGIINHVNRKDVRRRRNEWAIPYRKRA